MATRITSTELDRALADILNRVAYRGESFIIERGGRELARLEPVGPKLGVTFEEIAERLRGMGIPEGLADDLEAVRAEEPPLETPEWPD
jgi:antitoxin (DNA-binding transcriptional repressor) of toxin-antitoxin stability system